MSQPEGLRESKGYLLPTVELVNSSEVLDEERRSESHERIFELPVEPSIPQEIESTSTSLQSKIGGDLKHFYSLETLTLLGIGFGAGSALAYTNADETLQEPFQRAFYENQSSQFLKSFKELGNGNLTVPVFAGAWVYGELRPDDPFAGIIGDWGERTSRGFIVGGPPILGLQMLTGGSRPGETGRDARWAPFQDNNGVSGHAFVGALPFITAARMSDTTELKALYYCGSVLVPLSRVNDNAHYSSQAALGWWVAYLSANAVNDTEEPVSRWRFFPYSDGAFTGVMGEIRY